MKRPDQSVCVCALTCSSLMFLLEGVALLPFVDERRLRAALADVYPDLTPEEGENTPEPQAQSFLKEQTFIHGCLKEKESY